MRAEVGVSSVSRRVGGRWDGPGAESGVESRYSASASRQDVGNGVGKEDWVGQGSGVVLGGGWVEDGGWGE